MGIGEQFALFQSFSFQLGCSLLSLPPNFFTEIGAKWPQESTNESAVGLGLRARRDLRVAPRGRERERADQGEGNARGSRAGLRLRGLRKFPRNTKNFLHF